jgi:uncharacterized membrane protein
MSKFSVSSILVILLTAALLTIWVAITPPGLLGKADAIGYAVCHRIPSHSFSFGDQSFPLCARCTGTFLGVFIGMVSSYRLGKRAGYPGRKVLFVLGGFLLLFAVDGVNSFMELLNGQPLFYTPQNTIRLFTGIGVGIGMGSLLLPTFRQNLWAEIDERPILSTWLDLGITLLIAVLGALAILSGIPLFTYPLAFLSVLTIPLIFTLCFTILLVMLTGNTENYTSLRSAWFPLLLGFAITVALILLVDIGRYALTGTWAGFPLP